MSSWRDPVLAGIRAGAPQTGPVSVHIDVTNTCNAQCITCWDHSPLLKQPRSADWKRRRLSMDQLSSILQQLDALGSVRHMVLSGMGEPLTNPDIYDMIAAVKQRGIELTVITNLLAADPDRLARSGVDQLLVGVQGVTPTSYTGFHPGWTEKHFFEMCATLRRLASSPIRVRHVQVIDQHTAPEVAQMVQFAKSFGADRVNYKLASLFGGTEGTAISEDQREWLIRDGIPAARAQAERLQVKTNLELFERQVRTGGRSTAPMGEIGCYMGYVFTRITVDLDVLFCCNVHIKVGSLSAATFGELWYGPAWQALRDQLARKEFLTACDQCGKLEQNAKWAEHLGA